MTPRRQFRTTRKSKSRNQQQSASNRDQIFQQRNRQIRESRFLHQPSPHPIARESPHHAAYSSDDRARDD